jgi:polyhydroxyalkanoate synthase
VYKIQSLTDTEVTFVLASGGHNVGIVAQPGRESARYRVLKRGAEARYLDPDAWMAEARACEGSWWNEWTRWLDQHSGARRAPPRMGAKGYAPLCDAPGTYVYAD